jgi:hypothetical protein
MPRGARTAAGPPGLLEECLRPQGFEHIEHAEVIPGITRSLTAVKRRTDY